MAAWDGYAKAGDSIKIIAVFPNTYGGFTTGLAPTVTIAMDLAGSALVSGAAMTESTALPGIYWYAYTVPASGFIYAKATSTAGDSICTWIVGTGTIPDMASETTLQTVDGIVDAIKLKTDLIVSESAIADAIWDEVLTGSTHNIVNSAGKRLRDIASQVIWTGTAQGAGTDNNQIQLDTNASALNGAYDPAIIAIVDGTGAGQCRLILQYDGTTKMATVDRGWKVQPDDTSEFIIYADAGREHVNEGLARGGAANTITLNTNAAATDDNYNNQIIFIRSGTGEDQVRRVIDYDGTTKIATVYPAWNVQPDTTSGYVMLAFALPDLSGLETKIDTIDANVDLVLVDTANLMSTVEPYGDGYIFTENALQNAPVTTPSADVNVISVNGVSVTSPNDFKATGFSTFDPSVDLVKVGTNYDKTGYALANPDLCKADLTTAEANLATLLARVSATRAGYFDYIDDNYANINTLLARLTDTRAAKLDNVSQFDAATDVVYANIDLSDLKLDLNIALIHEALNTYPDSLPPGVNPPVVLPPDNTDAVKIYVYCFSKDSNTILTDCNGTLELLLSTEENGKHHKADPEAGTYYDDTGELFWLVPPYAKVRVQIPALKIDTIGYTGAGAETLRVDHLYKTPQVPA